VPVRIEQHGDDVLIAIKAVPGASRDQIVGPLGDRLKVRIAAPPEGGKANKAVCAIIARAVGVRLRDVTIESGANTAEKAVRVAGTTIEIVRRGIEG
jgi:uncharacterized protein (TIGR00251 family)